MSYPRLWTELASQHHRVSRRLVLALERARGLPMHLAFHVGFRNHAHDGSPPSMLSSLFLQHLSRHIEHVELLRITIGTDEPASSFSRLVDALAYPAPVLTQLSLVHVDGPTRDSEALHQLRESLFAGFAPRLTRLVLHNVLLLYVNRAPQPIPALQNARSFQTSLSCCRVPAFHSLHAGLPNLTEYEVQIHKVLAESLDVQSPTPIHAPLLRTIRLLHLTRDFTFLPYAACTRFSMERPPWAAEEDLWRGRAPPTRIAILNGYFGAADDAAAHRRAYRMTKMLSRRTHTADRLRFAAPYLRALIADSNYPVIRTETQARTPLVLPGLQYLHVICAYKQPFPTWLRAPALGVLRLSVPPEARGPSARRLSLFINGLACERGEVFLEMDGGDGLRLDIPPRFVLRAPSAPAPPHKFASEMGFEHWDDWMVDVLDRIPDV